jgi:hypothetical protein
MIRTRKIELASDEFFYLLLTIYLKKRWWLLAWVWVLIFILLLSRNIGQVEYLLIAFILVFQAILIGQYWIYAHSKDNQIYLLPRYYEIDADQVLEQMDDGTSSTIKTERILRVMKTGKCYLLFVAKNEYIHLPVNAFESPADLEWFETEIVKKIGKQG